MHVYQLGYVHGKIQHWLKNNYVIIVTRTMLLKYSAVVE